MTRAHTYSVEHLVHYQCGICKGIRAREIARGVPESEARTCWWSIADGPTEGFLFCPGCGQRRPVEPLDPEAPPTPEATDKEGIPFVEDDGTLCPWAEYVATDADGLVWQYAGRPNLGIFGPYWSERTRQSCIAPKHYALTDRPWTETLRRIKQ